MKELRILILIAFAFFYSDFSSAQHHHHKTHHRQHHAVKRSKYRPARVSVYHPHWAPQRAYHRRWVYFPVHRLYWDNWRHMYFYHNGRKWVSSKNKPDHVKDVDLDKEDSKELDEKFDDDDEIYLNEE